MFSFTSSRQFPATSATLKPSSLRPPKRPSSDEGARGEASPLPGGVLQRKCAACDREEERVDRKERSDASAPDRAGGEVDSARGIRVSHPGDDAEREADRVAAQVMQASEPMSPVKTTACTACGAGEPALQRRGVGPTSASLAPSAIHDVLRSSGQPLDVADRSFMEARFGHDFSRVRVHADARADVSVRAVDARAYTVGHDIAFASGEYAPQTAHGRALLAHELAHVVQQGHAGPGTAAASPGGAAPLTLQRFGSAEHVRIGQTAVPGTTVLVLGYGPIAYGEMIAMIGDFFESLDEMQIVARSGPLGRQQIDLVRWKVNPSSPRPTVDPAAEQEVERRYNSLAARNEGHFSTGASPGNSNRERYIDLHTRAIRGAYLAGLSPLTVQPHWPESLEAASNHYLTDAFSAGHVRTPRGEVQRHWNSLYPDFSNNLIRLIACYMAAYIRDVDRPEALPYVPAPVLAIRYKVEPIVRSMAGATLSSFGIGDFLSIAMHDADNQGLDVVSARGVGATGATPFRWRAVGDDHLYPSTANAAATQTQQMVEEAVRLSYDEVQQARRAGAGTGRDTLAALTNPMNFRALQLIPREDTGSTSNPAYAWRAPNIRALPANMQSILAAQFAPGTQIRNRLDSLAVSRCQDGVHAAQAFQCFRSTLLANPFNVIVAACEGNVCPPGNNNPCPGLPAGAACPA